jgi:hypothetical protein
MKNFQIIRVSQRAFILFFLFTSIVLASCQEIIEEPNISNARVELLAPANGVTLNQNELTFRWDFVTDATAYRIQLADPNFERPLQILVDSILEPDSLGLMTNFIDLNLGNGIYQWRVKALNFGYETAYSTHSFVVDSPPESEIVSQIELLTPLNDATQTSPVNFSWEHVPSPGISKLDSIYFYTDISLSEVVLRASGVNQSANIELGPGSYFWRIQTFDALGDLLTSSEVRNVVVDE